MMVRIVRDVRRMFVVRIVLICLADKVDDATTLDQQVRQLVLCD